MGDPAKSNYIFINSITPSSKGINIQFIILDMGPVHRTKDGSEVRTAWVADASASINVSIWNEAGNFMQPGDICRIRNGIASVHKGALAISAGRRGDVYKIGEFNMVYSDSPNMSVARNDLMEHSPRNFDGEDPQSNKGPPENHTNNRPPPNFGNNGNRDKNNGLQGKFGGNSGPHAKQHNRNRHKPYGYQGKNSVKA